jgi:hypothetical protein
MFSRLPGVTLEITTGRARNTMRSVAGPVYLIGGSNDCDLVLGDPEIADVHSYLLVTSFGVRLRHLGDDPEVRVNGHRVDVANIVDEDEVEIGSFSFRLHVDWTSSEQPLAGPKSQHDATPTKKIFP